VVVASAAAASALDEEGAAPNVDAAISGVGTTSGDDEDEVEVEGGGGGRNLRKRVRISDPWRRGAPFPNVSNHLK